MAEEAELERRKNIPAFRVPPGIVDDWTGQRYVDEAPCWGKEKPCPKLEDIRAAQQTLVQLEGDPYDPNWSDVDKIIKRYKLADQEKELQAQKMTLGDDPMGGINTIAHASAMH